MYLNFTELERPGVCIAILFSTRPAWPRTARRRGVVPLRRPRLRSVKTGKGAISVAQLGRSVIRPHFCVLMIVIIESRDLGRARRCPGGLQHLPGDSVALVSVQVMETISAARARLLIPRKAEDFNFLDPVRTNRTSKNSTNDDRYR
jgi:hypothetical protein